MRWKELSTAGIKVLPRTSVCVMPLGAIEQHGPHLPVFTDLLIAETLAEKLDDAFNGQLLVMPGPAIGCSEHHLAFAGTLSVSHETFGACVMESLDAAVSQGFKRFVLLNAHGGNAAIGSVIAERAARRWPETEVIFTTWFRLAGPRLRAVVQGEYPSVGHACEFETSVVLAIRPDLVDMSAARDDGTPQSSPLLRGDLLGGAGATLSRPFDRISKTGVWGKPTLATAEKGRQIIEITVDAFRQLITETWPDAGVGHSRGDA